MAATAPSEDDPFIRPPSPPVRPNVAGSFRGDGSVRVQPSSFRSLVDPVDVDARRDTDSNPSFTSSALDGQ